jgi:hypothetical protein
MSEERKSRRWALVLAVLMVTWRLASPQALAITVNVVDQNGAPIAGGFKWLIEEDNTHPRARRRVCAPRWAVPVCPQRHRGRCEVRRPSRQKVIRDKV